MIPGDVVAVDGAGGGGPTAARSRRRSPPLLDTLAVLVPLLFISATSGLQITELSVPDHADVGDTAELVCHHDLGDATLNSVKWYKDEREFFRYTPGESPRTRTFPLQGISLDLAPKSASDTKVTLTQLTFNSSGTYRCEVSADAPKFETVHRESNMTVMALPKKKLQIQGVEKAYSLGTVINATCTADRSNPPATVQWLINGHAAQSWQVGYHKPRERPEARHDNPLRLQAVWVGLTFTLDRTHFPGGRLELRCRSTINNIQALSQEVTTISMLDTNHKLAQRSPADRVSASLSATLLLSLALRCL